MLIADVPNAFIQVHMPEVKPGEDRVTMKITGVLVDLLIELDANKYGHHVVFEKGRKVVYVVVKRAIYGMLVASLLWYKKFTEDLKSVGFVFNPYDPCVANRMFEGKQLTTAIHVDDNKVSCEDPRALDWFVEWLNKMYGKFGEVKVERGKRLKYLGMVLDYTTPGEVSIDMSDYVKEMLEPFKLSATQTAATPAATGLFGQKEAKSKALTRDKSELFHSTVAKGLFVCKRGRPDIQPTIAILCTRVKGPSETDWQKMLRMLKYLNGTKTKKLRLGAGGCINVIKWYVDASFAVHPDYKSHTGSVMQFAGGRGAVQSISRKQKLNSRSSTEAEIIGTSDVSIMVLWTKLFLKEQGYETKHVIAQDNKASILLETNGRRSAGLNSRAMNIRYFWMTDQIERNQLSVAYTPTKEMVGDFMTKELQGHLFRKHCDRIMGQVTENPTEHNESAL